MTEPSNLTGEPTRPCQCGGWKSRVFMVVFFLLLLSLGGRLLWVASGTETGWSLLRSQWWDATVGLLAGRNVPISQQEPSDQAAFWLRETQRITAEETQSAKCAMGAALVLDSPATGFMFRYLTMPDFLKSSGQPKSASFDIGPQVDQKRLDSALAEFESACGPQCLAMAARATELEPGKVPWWQLRALLQVANLVYSTEQPRTPDWLRVVDQCGNHDPDNAIYDYIIVSRLWDDSIAYSFSGSETKLEVKDQQRFEDGLRHFERGQKKSNCRIEDGWCRPVVEFLGWSSIPRADQVAIAESRLIQIRISSVLTHLIRTQQRRAEQLERTGNPSGALTLLRQNLHCLDQFNQSEQSLEFGASSILRSSTLAMVQTLVEKHPELVLPRELASIKSDARAAILRNRVLVEASARLRKKQSEESFSMLTFVLVGIAVSTMTILLVTGAVCWLTGRYLSIGRERPAELLGLYRHTAAWLAGYGLSFAALGMAPAEIIPRVAQTWIVAALSAATVIAVSIWLLWKMVPILKRRCGVRTWLGIVLGSVVALGLMPILGAVSWDSLSVPARAWEGSDVDVLQHVLSAQPAASGGTWGWAAMQWCMAYPGAYAGLVISVGLLACWHTLRWARTGGHTRPRFRSRLRWAGLFTCLGRSMLIVGCGWLLVYLWLVPSVMQSAEDVYQNKMVYYRNPQEYWKTVRAAIGEVEVDKNWMNGLRSNGPSN